MGQILFIRDQKIGKCQRSCSVRHIGVRNDEGDATTEAESIKLGCLGTRNFFVFCVIYRKVKSNKFSSQGIVLVIFVPKKWPRSAVGRKIYGYFTRVLSFSCLTHQEARKILLECGRKTPIGQIMFRREWTTGKCKRLCNIRPVGVRSDEGDGMAKGESIPLDCSGPGNLFFV